MEKDEIIREVTDIVRRHLPDAYRIVLYGSWARGTAHKTSDVDIGILGETKVPHRMMVRIRSEVEAIPTLRSIDVVDLNAVSERFRNHVLEEAVNLT